MHTHVLLQYAVIIRDCGQSYYDRVMMVVCA